MSASTLVAYASRYGSTQEVAGAIAEALRAGGLTVDVQPARKVKALEGYGAVVLGAPLYLLRWHKDARRFLALHRQALTLRAVAVFALGPIHSRSDEQEWQGARAVFEQELAKQPWLKPVALELFGGKYHPARLRLPDSLIAALPASPLHGVPASDARDWGAIRAWADGLSAKLAPALLASGRAA